MEYSSGVRADGSTYTGGSAPDSIRFINSDTQNVNVRMGRGRDSVTFDGTIGLGAGTLVDLGVDNAPDRLVIASEEIVNGSGLRVLNFRDNVDMIEVAGTVYNTRADAEAAINGRQSGSISFGA
ncbi:MAG: hypothetical protein VKI83_11005 [Synechococcaceae cyanobacterium]|nr:hypothetical protein [Synechococcaceae cyanobacterium]